MQNEVGTPGHWICVIVILWPRLNGQLSDDLYHADRTIRDGQFDWSKYMVTAKNNQDGQCALPAARPASRPRHCV